MKRLFLHPMFFIGLGIRLAMIASMAPFAVSSWYLPFLDLSITHVSLDPWSVWLGSGGATAAFPYGYAMWFAFLPMIFVVKLVGLPLHYGYELTLLVADLSLLAILYYLIPGRHRFLLVVYWLSPIVILASYGLGLNDLIPALLLSLSMLFIRRVQFKVAGVLCAAAISAKLSMVVALPFFIIYLYNNSALKPRLSTFLAGFFVGALVLGAPFILSTSALQMLLSNPEMGKIYHLAFTLDGRTSVFVVPLIYIVMIYMAWRVKRLNFDLFQATSGMAFLSIVLMTPASPGWFVWTIPFLVLYQAMSDRIAIVLIGVFSGLYVLSTLLVIPIQISNMYELDLSDVVSVSTQFGSHTASLLHTLMVSIGVILAIRIWREAISRNDFFRLSRKPFVIGIAGDSGAGKDTFADSISGLFGKHSVVRLSGDDYRLWDRQKPMWQVMTHLNPMANDLEGFSNDLVSLIDRKSIQSRHYEHLTGKMSKPFRIKSNDFVIASGLHAFYLPILRECYNLRVYLDTDKALCAYFSLKHDVKEGVYTAEEVLNSLKKSELDSERFVRPQSAYADLLLSLQPIHPRMLEGLDDKHPLRLKLVVRTRHGFNEVSLNRILVGVCGLHVDIVVSDDGCEVQMTIEGETTAADVALAAELLCPRVLEFLDIAPRWQDGMVGLMQLITLSHINQALTKRFI